MRNQETEGLLSPWIRNTRLKKVVSSMEKVSVVLDLACGAGYMARFLPKGVKYYGVDKILTPHPDNFTDFLHLDLSAPNAFGRINEWLPQPPDCITSIAFLEHITKPEEFVANSIKLLRHKGRFIATTPHPRGRMLHESFSKIYLCSKHGAEEHEDFLGEEEIKKLAACSGGHLIKYEQFLWGLNQLFVIEYNT